jgi:hypothetical protein
MIREFKYLEELIIYKLSHYFPTEEQVPEPVIPQLEEWTLPLKNFVVKHQLSKDEAILLLVALVPHLQPDLFDRVVEFRLPESGNFPKLGGMRGKNSRTFLPTGETILFLLSGNTLESRMDIQQLFGSRHLFAQKKIAWLEELPAGEPAMSGRVILSQDYIDTFTLGKPTPPHFSINFPAQHIVEKRGWDALVINDELQKQIGEIASWLHYNEELMSKWGMQDRLKKGFRALFHGPPGTGKTLTAGLLGNEIGRDVYKVDLSMIVSKYIGETEKNLELLFARAEDKGWILFFDEADALFGKRTNVRDAHDKYANQEVSYLLQRIENYNGLIILATNMKNNIDDAFMRRFNAILKFPFPDAAERAMIWKSSFPQKAVWEKNLPPRDHNKIPEREYADIPDLVKGYELAGGNIINAVHYACLKAVGRRTKQHPVTMSSNGHAGSNGTKEILVAEEDDGLVIYLYDVLQGIKRELSKEGKPFLG